MLTTLRSVVQAFSMLYIGLETGLFTGYFDQNSHTLR